MNYIIAPVPVPMVEYFMPKIADDLQRVIDVSNDELTMDVIRNKALSGNGMLVLILHGERIVAVNLVEVRTFESGLKALFIPIVGGREMENWAHQFHGFCLMLAKEFGCTELRGNSVRKGWVRSLNSFGFNWEEVSTIISCKVT